MKSKGMMKHNIISDKTRFKAFKNIKSTPPCIDQTCFLAKDGKKNDRLNFKKKYKSFVKLSKRFKRSNVSFNVEFTDFFVIHENIFAHIRYCKVNEPHHYDEISSNLNFFLNFISLFIKDCGRISNSTDPQISVSRFYKIFNSYIKKNITFFKINEKAKKRLEQGSITCFINDKYQQKKSFYKYSKTIDKLIEQMDLKLKQNPNKQSRLEISEVIKKGDDVSKVKMLVPLEPFDNVDKRIKRMTDHEPSYMNVNKLHKNSKEKDFRYNEKTINDLNNNFITDINDVDMVKKDQFGYKEQLENTLTRASLLEDPSNAVHLMNIGNETKNISEKAILFANNSVTTNFKDGVNYTTLMWIFLAVIGGFMVVLCLIGSLLAFFLNFGDQQCFKKKQTNRNIILEDFELQTYE